MNGDGRNTSAAWTPEPSRPIGVFDSGLGGLTVVKKIIEQLPNEDIVYLGDTARVPYGDKSRETIVAYARQDVRFLLRQGIKALCIACNTADAMTRPRLEAEFDLPIIGAVEPAARRAVQSTRNKRIGVIGTAATVKSRAYVDAIERLAPDVRVFQKPCPLLVPLVEAGRFHRGDIVVETVLHDYLQPLIDDGIDTIILGCTHYPLLYDIVADLLPGAAIICSGYASVDSLADRLRETGLLNKKNTPGEHRFFVTDAPDRFARHGAVFMGMPMREICSKVTLEED